MIVDYLLKEQKVEGQIGGDGIFVQIDEAKFGARKYNRGRRVEGHWVLGIIAEGSNDLRLIICPENKRKKLSGPLLKNM